MNNPWPNGMNIYFNESNCPVPTSEMEGYVKYACDSWKVRTGIDVQYKGVVTAETATDGAVVRWVTPEWIVANIPSINILENRGFCREWHISGKKEIGLNLVGFKDSISLKNRRTLTHEIGHALIPGQGDHLEDLHATMAKYFSIWTKPRYALSMADYMPVMQPNGSPFHCELTQENDLYIPEIDGHRALLKYTGDGLIHSWKLEEFSICPQATGDRTSYIDWETRKLYLTDVRAGAIRVDAILTPLEGDNWRLEYAEYLPSV